MDTIVWINWIYHTLPRNPLYWNHTFPYTMDELRYRAQQQPHGDANMGSFVSPPRNGGSRLPQPTGSHDPRSSLPRRFTADSGRVPTLGNLGAPQRAPEPQDIAASTVRSHTPTFLSIHIWTEG